MSDDLREVGGEELEDEGERGLGVDDVVEGDDVGVLELLEEAGLPDGGERGALLFLQPDLLEGHHLEGRGRLWGQEEIKGRLKGQGEIDEAGGD